MNLSKLISILLWSLPMSALGQIEGAETQAADTAVKARNLAKEAAEDARQRASKQMEQARKTMEEARKQWQKQVAEARKQMQNAAKSLRAAARQERLTSMLPVLGILVKPSASVGNGAPAAVVGVTPGSPADKAGLKPGDVLTAIEGHSMEQPRDGGAEAEDNLSSALALLRRRRPGEKIAIEYRRGNESRRADLELEGRSHRWTFVSDDSHGEFRFRELPGHWFELELVAVNPDLGEYFGTPRGLLVLRASTASEIKLKPGDVILKIGDEQPSTPTQAVRLLRSYEPGQTIPVEILRQKQKQQLVIQFPREDSGKR